MSEPKHETHGSPQSEPPRRTLNSAPFNPPQPPAPQDCGTRPPVNGRAAGPGFSEASAAFVPQLAQLRTAPPRQVYGALDLGTNNCRLIVMRPSSRGMVVLDTFSRIIRLGEGVGTTGVLSEAAMDRTVEALKICAGRLDHWQVNRARLIATEACRVARNTGEFLDRVHRETGLRLEVISRESEARLAVAGCASLLDRRCQWALVFDIGGGSTELIWLNLSRLKKARLHSPRERVKILDCITAWTSLPIGVVTLAEQFGGRDVDGAVFEQMVAKLSEHLAVFERQTRISSRIKNGGTHLIGTSGTVTTVAGVHLKLPYYSRNKVDGTWLNTADIREVSQKLLDMGYDSRVAEPCIGAERADLVLAGCAILEALLRAWPCERLRVADRGLRDGILTTLMAEDGQPDDRAVQNGARKFRHHNSRT